MGIRFYCGNGHKIHVKAFLAGKRGICPKCGVKVDIPGNPQKVGAKGVAPSTAEPHSSPAQNASPHMGQPTEHSSAGSSSGTSAGENSAQLASGWYVRGIDGQQYGPADDAVFQSWIVEGRVSAECFVWRDGWEQWRSAVVVLDARNSGDKPPESPVINIAVETASDGVAEAAAIDPTVGERLAGEDVADKPEVRIDAIAPPFRKQTKRSKSMLAVYVLALACILLLAVMIFVLINMA